MGVEAFYYSYDKKWFEESFPHPVNIDTLLNANIISEEGEVTRENVYCIREIKTHMSGTKQWYNNLMADVVYEHVRPEIPLDLRKRVDEIFNLLFWDRGDNKCRFPDDFELPVFDSESSCWSISAQTIQYVLENQFELELLRAPFVKAMEGWSEEERITLKLRALDDFEVFIAWVEEWIRVFEKAQSAGFKSANLLIYVSI